MQKFMKLHLFAYSKSYRANFRLKTIRYRQQFSKITTIISKSTIDIEGHGSTPEEKKYCILNNILFLNYLLKITKHLPIYIKEEFNFFYLYVYIYRRKVLMCICICRLQQEDRLFLHTIAEGLNPNGCIDLLHMKVFKCCEKMSVKSRSILKLS